MPEVKQDWELAAKAQMEYTSKNNLPLFAYDVCWKCRKNIYMPTERTKGISFDDASRMHITSCPHCGVSYCN